MQYDSPIRNIQARYGGKNREAVNRGIRAELTGGNNAMDALSAISECKHQLHGRRGPEWTAQQHAVEAALAACSALRDAMAAELISRYQ